MLAARLAWICAVRDDIGPMVPFILEDEDEDDAVGREAMGGSNAGATDDDEEEEEEEYKVEVVVLRGLCCSNAVRTLSKGAGPLRRRWKWAITALGRASVGLLWSG